MFSSELERQVIEQEVSSVICSPILTVMEKLKKLVIKCAARILVRVSSTSWIVLQNTTEGVWFLI